MVTVHRVQQGTPLLAAVKLLWRVHSQTLGFLPDGAFDEYASQGTLLAAMAVNESLCGYVLFRVDGAGCAFITHLCVAPEARKVGIARLLFGAVLDRVDGCYEIRVRCRRDFEASKLWPRLGFDHVGDVPGRGHAGMLLSNWRYPLKQLPLLAQMTPPQQAPLRVVIDANVFFDLDEGDPGREESKALQADWLTASMEMALTAETFNEINRRNDVVERSRQQRRAREFQCLEPPRARETQIVDAVYALLPSPVKESDHSDRRQLAKTIASDVLYFVTRDGPLLDQADKLYAEFGLIVTTPHELISRLDELRRESEYRPSRLFMGTQVQRRRILASDVPQITELHFTGQSTSERKSVFFTRLKEIVASPDRFDGHCLVAGDELLAAWATDRATPGALRVPVLTVTSSSLGPTAARHLLCRLTVDAAEQQRYLVEVPTTAVSSILDQPLVDAGFVHGTESWSKLALPIVAPWRELPTAMECLAGPPALHEAAQTLQQSLVNAQTIQPPSSVALALERRWWPAKITDAGARCFIVPIKSRWAKELFDTEFAQRSLFGADPKLAMNSENAYYRAALPAVLAAPSRILWYVSQDRDYPGSMALRASSYLTELVAGLPSPVYARFRRLGVYEWRDVLSVANKNLRTKIMAFRFDRTELFARPIRLRDIHQVLVRHGRRRSQFQGPLEISEACYMELYVRGMMVGGRSA